MASGGGGGCYSCNGVNAKCIHCVCVKRGTPCVSCLPKRMDMCRNTLDQKQKRVQSITCSAQSVLTGPSLVCETSVDGLLNDVSAVT